ncbi:MAG: methyl-accepting chemotaxis protein, partial [Gammaproteobacteria bacterium]|nr:methyl-accepting chemotaxis protein [Gammaproteobacteria bacterium]
MTKDFMLRGADKYVGRIDQRRKEFDGLLKETSLTDKDKAEISGLLSTYQSSFHTYAKTAKGLKPEAKQLSKIFADMG